MIKESFLKSIQKAELTKQQKKIADYCIKNQHRIFLMSSLELAKEIGVSDASIIRFARAIGYGGFSDLKADLYEQVTAELSRPKVGQFNLSQRFDMQTKQYSDTDMPEELLSMLPRNVDQSLRQNGTEKYEQIADALHRARRVYLIGLRGAKGTATHFGRLLGYLLDNVRVITKGEDEDVVQLHNLTKEDMVLSISYARYYKLDTVLADLISEQEAVHCAISDSVTAPMAKVADVVCLTETSHMAFFNSVVGTTAMLEDILTLLCWKYSGEYQHRLERGEMFLNEIRN